MSATGRIARLMIVAAALIATSTPASPAPLLLFTPDEASELRFGAERPRIPLLRGPAPGPRIVVQHPPVVRTSDGPVMETTPSTRFAIAFEPHHAPVDMQSLDIKARKGVFSVSLTPRLKPYISGTRLQAETVSVPEGRFVIQIEIADQLGTRTAETYRLEVRKGNAAIGIEPPAYASNGILSLTTRVRGSRSSR